MGRPRLHLAALLLAVGICAVRAAADTVILPTDPNIEYIGRFDRRAANAPAFDWPATTLRVRFAGTRIAVMLNNTGASYRFRAFVDGVAVPDVICATIGSNTYPIITGLAAGTHCLELLKKNEEDAGTPLTRFLGFILDDGATLLPPAAMSQRKILFVGDSFTVGYGAGYTGVPRGNYGHTDKLTNDDAWITYAAQISRRYQAQAQIVARSGIGVYCLYNTIATNDSMRKRIRQTLFANELYYYDFHEWAPQLVVVALGINDFSTYAKPSVPTQAQFEGAYHELLNVLTAWYPHATYALCVLGDAGYWHAYVKNVALARGYAYTNALLGTGDYGLDHHPNPRGHSNMAATVSALIDTLPVAWPGSNMSLTATAPIARLTSASDGCGWYSYTLDAGSGAFALGGAATMPNVRLAAYGVHTVVTAPGWACDTSTPDVLAWSYTGSGVWTCVTPVVLAYTSAVADATVYHSTAPGAPYQQALLVGEVFTSDGAQYRSAAAGESVSANVISCARLPVLGPLVPEAGASVWLLALGFGACCARAALRRAAPLLMALALLALFCLCGRGWSAVAQYEFDGALTARVGGADLVPGYAAPASSAGLVFTNVLIGGQPAHVAALTRGTYLSMPHGLGANGGGTYLNQYTLLMDVLISSRPANYAALYQTAPANNNDADWFVQNAGIGIEGIYAGSVPDGVWHRLAAVVNNADSTFTCYVNGTQAVQRASMSTDGRWALAANVLLFADEDQENAPVLVNSVQLRDTVMTAAELAALGGPRAEGIALPAMPQFALLSPNGGEHWPADSDQTIAWTSSNALGLLRVELLRGEALAGVIATVPVADSNCVWHIHPATAESNDYRVRLSSVAFPSVTAQSAAPFAISGGVSTGVMFGQSLLSNGTFEALLDGWTITAGTPAALDGGAGKGTPHAGARFWHGGISTTDEYAIVRQDVDLLAHGFTPAELDCGVLLAATGWLRSIEVTAPAAFDDQGWLRIGCLDAGGTELRALRTRIAASHTWVLGALHGLLPAGTRTLRVEVIGRRRRGSDNDAMADDIDVRLHVPLVLPQPAITKLPMLQDVRTNAMTFLWETDGNTAAQFLEWGRLSVAEHTLTNIESLQIDATHVMQRAVIVGLEPATTYVYRVRCGTHATPVFSFNTPPRPGMPFSIGWTSDSHDGRVALTTHLTNMLPHRPALLCSAGDGVYNGDVIGEWHTYWYKPFETLNAAQTIPVIFARGNHDNEYYTSYGYSLLPGNEAWFAFDVGAVRMIFLDSEVSAAIEPTQRTWLIAELERPATRAAAFRIVCFHRPPFANLWDSPGYDGEAWVRSEWVPLLEQHHVDLVVSGHAHAYQRGTSNGVTYVVTGGGGGALDTYRGANWPFVAIDFSQFHFDIMSVSNNVLFWCTYGLTNQLLDSFTLTSRTPELRCAPPTATTTPLIITGKPGTPYIVEQSTDLAGWTPLATNLLPVGGGNTLTSAVPWAVTNTFYRARAGD